MEFENVFTLIILWICLSCLNVSLLHYYLQIYVFDLIEDKPVRIISFLIFSPIITAMILYKLIKIYIIKNRRI